MKEIISVFDFIYKKMFSKFRLYTSTFIEWTYIYKSSDLYQKF